MTMQIPERSIVTIADHGERLCIGHKDTSLSLRPWTTEEEMELGELAEKYRGASMWKTLEMVVSTMVANFGGLTLWRETPDGDYKPAMSELEREVALQGMYFADMLLAYVHIRIAALGPDLPVTLKDPYDNGKEFTFTADLRTIEVEIPKSRDDLTFSYELARPVKRGEKTIRSLVLGPHRWAVHTAYETSNRLMVPLDMCAHAVNGVPDLLDGAFTMDRKIMASFKLQKLDLSRISDALEAAAFGPKLILEVPSPATGKPIVMPIDWQYSNFFKASSR